MANSDPEHALVSLLEPLNDDAKGKLQSTAAARFRQLPNELQDQILHSLTQFTELLVKCTYIVSPQIWFRVLTWDMDWELLVRRLAQPIISDDQGIKDSLPVGLRNRQRIWRILSEMRVGDMTRFWNIIDNSVIIS